MPSPHYDYPRCESFMMSVHFVILSHVVYYGMSSMNHEVYAYVEISIIQVCQVFLCASYNHVFSICPGWVIINQSTLQACTYPIQCMTRNNCNNVFLSPYIMASLSTPQSVKELCYFATFFLYYCVVYHTPLYLCRTSCIHIT